VIVIWLIPFVLLIAGLAFFLERPGAALEATPRAAMPTLTLEPPSGLIGTVVRVHGEGWPAGSLVSTHLMARLKPPSRRMPSAVPSSMKRGAFSASLYFQPNLAGRVGPLR
jgi:hypothetical protein